MHYLWRFIRKYWYFYLLGFVAMMISILLDMTAPKITQMLIDKVIVGGQIALLMRLLFGLLGIGIGRAIFQYVKEFTFDCIGVSIGCKIRKELLSFPKTRDAGCMPPKGTDSRSFRHPHLYRTAAAKTRIYPD